ncbi:hypothetical protein ES705_45335 [subsurface metagenome]
MYEDKNLLQNITIPFFGTCLANSELVLVSKRLNFRYITKKIIAFFALNTNHTLQIIPYLSYDPTAPVTGLPSGSALFSPYGQVGYLSGDDEHEEHQHELIVNQIGSYLKIYANNTDSFDHTVDAQIQIQVYD